MFTKIVGCSPATVRTGLREKQTGAISWIVSTVNIVHHAHSTAMRAAHRTTLGHQLVTAATADEIRSVAEQAIPGLLQLVVGVPSDLEEARELLVDTPNFRVS